MGKKRSKHSFIEVGIKPHANIEDIKHSILILHGVVSIKKTTLLNFEVRVIKELAETVFGAIQKLHGVESVKYI